MAEHKRPLFRDAATYLKNATLGDFQLEKKNMKVMHIRVVLSFSLAIWKTRRFYRVAVGAPALNQAHRRVLLELTPLLCSWLGGGRRNKEELEAIKDATALMLGEPNVGPIYIFSDNRLAIRVAMGRAHPEWAAEVSKSICENITALSATRVVYLMWVPGHADVPGNEVADKLAKLGSSGVSGAWTNLTELPKFSAPQPESAGPDAGHGIPTGCEQCARVLQGMLATANPRRRPPRKA
ncbi:MAG: ribonuclease H family protein, partial [Promethearchaeia archaeon]